MSRSPFIPIFKCGTRGFLRRPHISAHEHTIISEGTSVHHIRIDLSRHKSLFNFVYSRSCLTPEVVTKSPWVWWLHNLPLCLCEQLIVPEAWVYFKLAICVHLYTILQWPANETHTIYCLIRDAILSQERPEFINRATKVCRNEFLRFGYLKSNKSVWGRSDTRFIF